MLKGCEFKCVKCWNKSGKLSVSHVGLPPIYKCPQCGAENFKLFPILDKSPKVSQAVEPKNDIAARIIDQLEPFILQGMVKELRVEVQPDQSYVTAEFFDPNSLGALGPKCTNENCPKHS